MIYLVNGDSREREELVELLSIAEIDVVSFASAAEYLEFDRTDTSACLVVDMHLPDIGSFEQQGHLVNRAHPPVVFLSGPCDISTAVRAMKAGAIDILAKPRQSRCSACSDTNPALLRISNSGTGKQS